MFRVALLSLCLALVAPAQRTPRVTLSAIQATDGDLVELRGTGFTPNKRVLSHLLKPNQTEHPVVPFHADDRGEFSHTIETLLLLPGTHELWVIDDSSEAVSNRVRFTVGFGNASPAPPEVQEALAPYAGVWRGSVSRNTSSGTLAVLIAITGKTGSIAGTVAYPGQECGGILTFRTVSSDSIEVTETITYGAVRCLSNGLATLKLLQDGSIAFQWRHASLQGASTAQLTPVK